MPNEVTDMTPLPSPKSVETSPQQFWDQRAFQSYQTHLAKPSKIGSVLVTQNGESISSAVRNQLRRLSYQGLPIGENGLAYNEDKKMKEDVLAEIRMRNRSDEKYLSRSEIPNNGRLAISRAHAPLLPAAQIESIMPVGDVDRGREPDLISHLRLESVPRPPTPPPSRKGTGCSESELCLTSVESLSQFFKKSEHNHFMAYGREDMKLRQWKSLKLLGKGTFSKVFLATSHNSDNDLIDKSTVSNLLLGTAPSTPPPPPFLVENKSSKNLVAVKICDYGPKGGAPRDQVEVSIKREIELMKDICHPSIIQLKAWNFEESRAILVLDFCPGGDLFDIASDHHDLLVPNLLGRIFSELVGAVRYLHRRNIVHRDIKLENILVNISLQELLDQKDWSRYPYSVVTLTDLGLARRITENEKLMTRCGSDDYAAPEVVMGQAYDGRATDAWSLGVLLYALLESRLPFDPIPNASRNHKQQGFTSHRIARVEWQWVKFAGLGDEHGGDPEKFCCYGLEDSMLITEGLLRRARNRWKLDQVAETKWIKNAIQLENGILYRDEQIPEEAISVF